MSQFRLLICTSFLFIVAAVAVAPAATNYTLIITGSPANYGSSTPLDYGTHTNIADYTWITNTVGSPTDTNGIRYACTGWGVTTNGTIMTNGADTEAVFQLITNMTLTWNWTNTQYLLTVSASPGGSVNTNVNGWYTNGVSVTGITAMASNGYAFSQWTGDVPAGDVTNKPLTVTMDQVRTIQGNFGSTSGVTKTWTGSGNWASSTNWSPDEGMPGLLDDAIIASGSVILGNPTWIASLIVSNNATLTFTNWNSVLTASDDVTVQSNGVITLPAAFTDSQMSNNVYIACSNLMIDAVGSIDADSKGYAGGPENTAGYGPGRGNTYRGGGYGGQAGGADGVYGCTYGSSDAPLDPGSGGGAGPGDEGGGGGGAVRIEATGAVMVNGTITANGANGKNGNNGGGGSGGGIYITCNTFAGTNGIVRANAGNGGKFSSGGGGGRIALVTRKDELTGEVPGTYIVYAGSSNGCVSVDGGTGTQSGTNGTFYLEILPPEGTVISIW